MTAAERHGVDLGRSFMVGDRWRDIEAGARAGVTTVWVRSDYSSASRRRPITSWTVCPASSTSSWSVWAQEAPQR